MTNTNQAKVTGKDLPVSFKDCIEIGNFVRGMKTKKAITKLENVVNQKVAVPMKRFNFDRGHKKGMGAGRYPVKAAGEIIKLIKSAEANAQNQGLITESLFIKEFIANKGAAQWHYGRKIRRKAKKTHIKIVLEEKSAKKEEKGKTEAKKTEVKNRAQ